MCQGPRSVLQCVLSLSVCGCRFICACTAWLKSCSQTLYLSCLTDALRVGLLWGCPTLPAAGTHPGRGTVWRMLRSCLGEEVQIRGKVGCSLHMGHVMALCVLGSLRRGQKPLQHGCEQGRQAGQRDRCITQGIIDITPASSLRDEHLFSSFPYPEPMTSGCWHFPAVLFIL